MSLSFAPLASACRTAFNRGASAAERRNRPSRDRSAAVESLEERIVLSATGWVQAVPSSGTIATINTSIAAANGDMIVAGTFQGTPIDLDGSGPATPLAIADGVGQDGFTARYDAAGNLLWARQISGRAVTVEGHVHGSAAGGDLAVDRAGNVYRVGTFSGRIEFIGQDAAGNPRVEAILTAATTASTSGLPTDVFFCKYAADGRLLWAKAIGSPGTDFGMGGIAVYDADPKEANWSVYIAGQTYKGADFDPGSAKAVRNSWGGFVAKYSASTGNYQWVRQAIDQHGQFQGVAVDANGVYVGGLFTEGVTIENNGFYATVSSTGTGGLLAAYSHSGSFRWSQTIDGAADDFVWDVAVANGNVYAVGEFQQAADFETTHETRPDDLAGGARNGFVARYAASTGRLAWARGMSGDATFVKNVAVNAATRQVAVNGMFRGTIDFGGDLPPVTSEAEMLTAADGLVVLLSDAGASPLFTHAWRIGGTAGGNVLDVNFDPRGTGALYLAGTFSAGTVFPNGQTFTPDGRTDPFFARLIPSAESVTTGATSAPFARTADAAPAGSATTSSAKPKQKSVPVTLVVDDERDRLFSGGTLLDLLLAG